MTSRDADDQRPAARVRDPGIDLFRFLMAMLVILLHILPSTWPTPGNPWGSPRWAVVADAVCRAAVPFFFIASGYYFRVDRGVAANIRRAVTRLAPIYLFWMAIYLGVAVVFAPTHLPGRWQWLTVFDGEPGFHLWFIPALIFALLTLTVTLALGGRGLAVAVALLFALAGPILGAYYPLLGIDRYPPLLLDLRRQLAAPAYVAIGYLLRTAPPVGVRTSVVLCVLALIAGTAERYLLFVVVGNHAVIDTDGLVLCFCFGAAVFLLARSLNGMALASRLAPLGRLSLAVYLCHIVFLWAWQAVLPAIPGRVPVLWMLIAGSATGTAAILVRIRWLRRFTT